MKKIIGIFAIFVCLLTFVTTSFADNNEHRVNRDNWHDNDDHNEGKWKLASSCEITYTLDNVGYTHTYTLTNGNNGAFSGTGSYNPDPSYTEDITGNVTGNAVTFHVLYTGTSAGYTLDATGAVSNTGVISGTATDSLSRSFTFASTASCATKGGNDHHNLRLDWRRELTASKCNGVGRPIVNVRQKVKNDADSGFAGYWAIDQYTRDITVYKTATVGTYCATVEYDGKFVSFAGASPNNTGTIAAGIKGEMNGGYRSTLFTGALLSTPLWPTHGNVGTTDYNCDNLGNCPGRIDWTTKYFSTTSGFDLAWWGWIYNTQHHGTWINAISGSVGDIL